MIGFSIAATMFSVSASMTIFSYEVSSPPSSQPAPCRSRLTPPMTAPHREKTLS